MSNYKYKFSIISAVYNVEDFLAEAIESIIAQTIGIDNIQFILVDDGSTDGSAEICDEYAAKYPNNIFVVHKGNAGVSSARNIGLELVQGEFVNFMDSDDMLSADTLERVYKLFSKNYDKTDVVAIPLELFDGANGGHILNHKFDEGTRIADLTEEWNLIQMSSSSSFIKSDAIKGMTFDTRLAYGEDAKFMQKVLVKKQTLGLESKARYMYRKRTTGAPSALQNSLDNPKWYLPSVKYFLKELIDYSEEILGYVPKFIQYVIMYDAQWRIKQKNLITVEFLTQEEKEEYISILKEIFIHIDEDIILCQKNLNREQRLVALEMKYSSLPEVVIDEKDIFCTFSDEARFSLANSKSHIEFLQFKNGVAKIEGYLEIYNIPFNEFEFSFWINSQKVETKLTERKSDLVFLNRDIVKRIGFSVEIKLDPSVNKYNIRLGAVINGKLIFFQKYSYGYFCPITCDYRFSHFVQDDWMATAAKNHIVLARCSALKQKSTELKFLLWLFKNNKNDSRSQVLLRFWYHIAKKFAKKPIWLISDRPNSAGDNGEAFFRYMVAEHPEIDARFVINNDSPDYKKMKDIGPVVKRLSLKHKFLVLLSEYIFSSQGENEQFDPFGKKRNVYKDILATKRFVFLQHGVTINNLSSWLFRQNKNIFGFVTTAKDEYDSFLQYEYDYTSENVWLTGFPRFDRLYDDSQKIISIMPTWRKYLTAGNNPLTQEWNVRKDFDNSEYFNFYNSLINNSHLLETARRTGYKIDFLLHPNLRAAAEFFNANDVVSIVTEDIDYNRSFAISDMIVTDYSSTFFDFSYLRKPIIYTQFDFNDFFSGLHSVNKGYFDYEEDGFGEVEYDLQSSVDRIIEYMESGCQLKDKYRDRIDSFFAFNDTNNSQRVYKEAIEHRKS